MFSDRDFDFDDDYYGDDDDQEILMQLIDSYRGDDVPRPNAPLTISETYALEKVAIRLRQAHADLDSSDHTVYNHDRLCAALDEIEEEMKEIVQRILEHGKRLREDPGLPF